MATLLRFILIASLALIWSGGLTSQVQLSAQDKPWNSQFGDMLQADDDDDGPVFKLAGDFTVEQGTTSGTLNITFDIKKGWHGYPQEEVDGQVPTTLTVKRSDLFEIVGPFTANQKPKKRLNEFGALAEEFSGRVIWSAPIEFKPNVDAASLQITTEVVGQVCKTSCIPMDETVVARFSKYTTSVGKYASDHITLTGQIDKTTVKPGGKLNLTIGAKIVPDWHIYRREDTKAADSIGPIPTIISFDKLAGFKVKPPKPSKQPIRQPSKLADGGDIYFHEDEVLWQVELQAPKEAKKGRYELTGNIVFQVCSDDGCDMPTALDFKFPVEVADAEKSDTKSVALAISGKGYDSIIQAVRRILGRKSERSQGWSDLAIDTGGVSGDGFSGRFDPQRDAMCIAGDRFEDHVIRSAGR